MITIQEYLKATITFVNSLIIKIDEIHIHQNYHTYVKYGLTPPSRSDSKYYQNITGSLNNNDYLFKIPTTNLDFNRKNLRSVPSIHNKYLKFDNDFNKLCSEKVGMSDYIRGCLIDITMDEIIELDNYKVIHHNKSFLTDNELAIIPKIESYVKNYMTTYNNNKMMIDELFLPGQLSVLFNGMVLYILSVKFGNIQSNQVDIFHLSHKLQSYKNTYSSSKIFNLPTNIWLYGNVNRLRHNVGKNFVLDEILTNVYDKNLFGIGNVVYTNTIPEIIEDNINDASKEFYKHMYSMELDRSNKSCYNINDKSYTADVLEGILRNNDLKINHTDVVATDKTLRSAADKHRTGMFLLDQPEKIRTHFYNTFIFLLSNIIHLFKVNDYTFTLDVFNRKDNKLYTLTTKDILYILIYRVYKLYNLETNHFTIRCNGVFKTDFDTKEILNKTLYKDRLTSLLDYLTNNDSLTVNIFNLETLNLYLETIRELDTKILLTKSNIVDSFARTDVQVIGSNLFNTIKYDFELEHIETYLSDMNLITFTDVHSIKLETLLFRLTNIEISDIAKIQDKFKKAIKFFDNFTSYTVDLVTDNEFLDSDNLISYGPDLNIGYKPILKINDTRYKLLEDFDFYVGFSNYVDENLDVNNKVDYVLAYDTTHYGLPCLVSSTLIEDYVTTDVFTKKLMPKDYTVNIENKTLDTDNDILHRVSGLEMGLDVIDTGIKISDIASGTVNEYQTTVEYKSYRGIPYIITDLQLEDDHDNLLPIQNSSTDVNLIKEVSTARLLSIKHTDELDTTHATYSKTLTLPTENFIIGLSDRVLDNDNDIRLRRDMIPIVVSRIGSVMDIVATDLSLIGTGCSTMVHKDKTKTKPYIIRTAAIEDINTNQEVLYMNPDAENVVSVTNTIGKLDIMGSKTIFNTPETMVTTNSILPKQMTVDIKQHKFMDDKMGINKEHDIIEILDFNKKLNIDGKSDDIVLSNNITEVFMGLPSALSIITKPSSNVYSDSEMNVIGYNDGVFNTINTNKPVPIHGSKDDVLLLSTPITETSNNIPSNQISVNTTITNVVDNDIRDMNFIIPMYKVTTITKDFRVFGNMSVILSSFLTTVNKADYHIHPVVKNMVVGNMPSDEEHIDHKDNLLLDTSIMKKPVVKDIDLISADMDLVDVEIINDEIEMDINVEIIT